MNVRRLLFSLVCTAGVLISTRAVAQDQEEGEAAAEEEAAAGAEAESPAPGAPAPRDVPAPSEGTSSDADSGAEAAGGAAAPDASTETLSEEDALLLQMAEEAAAADEGEVIIVTGSAVQRKDLTTPAPVAVIDRKALEASGLASVGDVLKNLPSQSNAINTSINNGGDGSTRISLRGLGSGRTLVLVNGRRHVPGGTGANSSVDLNAIPIAVIKRIEVLKDGGSAIYGSDAISGVVNIITETEYDGATVNLYTGTTPEGGGTTYDISAVTGVSSERGSAVFSAGYFEQRAIGAGDRPFSRSDRIFDWQSGEYILGGSTTVPSTYIRDRTGAAGNEAWDDVVNNNESGIYTRDSSGVWRDFDGGGNSDTNSGDLYNYQPENHLLTPSQRFNAYTAGRYKLIDKHLEAFFELSYLSRRSDQRFAPTPLTTLTEGITYSAESVYNPFGRDFIDVRRRMVEAGPRQDLQEVSTFRIVTGVEGEVPELPGFERWRWNLSYVFGRTDSSERKEGRFIRSRLAEAIGPSFRDADGVARCGTVDNPGSSECVPLDLLGGEGSISQEMLDYISYTGTADGFNQQHVVEVTAGGPLAEFSSGGSVALAIGASYRNEDGESLPDPLTASGDTTGNKAEPTSGGFDVAAGFAELSVIPVVKKPFAERIELVGAVRAFRFDTFGADFTWKTGALWKIAKGASLRGTYSTAFRAPSIGALYSGTATGFPGVSDPCDTSQGPRDPIVDANCRADGIADDYTDDRQQIQTLFGGNSELEPETAKVFTVGAVWEVPWVPGLSTTIDYWNVSLDNAITTQGASVILSNCYAQESRADCDKIDRDSTGFIRIIRDLNTNIGGAETSGVDFAVRYDRAVDPLGRFTYTIEGTWLHKYDEIQPSRRVEGLGVYDLGIRPKLRANSSLIWGRGAYGAGANARFTQGFRECEDNDCSGDNSYRNVDANTTYDLFLSYSEASVLGRSTLSMGVNNVFNTRPSLIYNGFTASTDPTAYDVVGRYAYLRFTQSY